MTVAAFEMRVFPGSKLKVRRLDCLLEMQQIEANRP